MSLRPPDHHRRTALVTGATSGIGEALAIRLVADGFRVVITGRSKERGEAALDRIRAHAERGSTHGSVELGLLDLGALDSVRRFAHTFRTDHDRLDLLVLNAGAILDRRIETIDGFEQMFAVNHLGHALLTDLLLDLLESSAPARIIAVSSIAHRRAFRGLDFDDLQSTRRFRPFHTYARTKLANILLVRQLARELADTGVIVNAVHPGNVDSRFGRDGDSRILGPLIATFGRFVLKSPDAGARAPHLLATSDDPRHTVTGAYFSKTRRRRPSRAARDPEAARRLREISIRLTATTPEDEPT